jgi:uncharacterized iron-regulated protein
MRCQTAVIGLLTSTLLLAGCTSFTKGASALDEARLMAHLLPAEALLVGEQHDAPDHQRLHARVVTHLTARGQLAALTLEMAERGTTTAGLPPEADEARVRAALRWSDAAWPWKAYGPAVMAAVRAGVPVLGANLPRTQQAHAMADETLDASVPPPSLARLRLLVRDGHCGLLPEVRVPAMTRIQIARDRSMAATLTQAARAGSTVVLLAGQNHVRRGIGVPLHLPHGMEARVLLAVAGAADLTAGPEDITRRDRVWVTPAVAPVDDCAGLRGAPGSRTP